VLARRANSELKIREKRTVSFLSLKRKLKAQRTSIGCGEEEHSSSFSTVQLLEFTFLALF
jgi:hypothetical protein